MSYVRYFGYWGDPVGVSLIFVGALGEGEAAQMLSDRRLGVCIDIVGEFFFLSNDRDILTVGGVLNCIGLILAFVGAVGSCRPEMLPIIGSADEKATEAVDKVIKDLDQES